MLQFIKLKQLIHWMQLDRAVLYCVLGRVWGAFSGSIGLWFVGTFLLPDEQGYYYTFSSVLALQVFAELGLSYIITQFASHEWAHLETTESGIVVGSAKALSRLSSILRYAIRWYVLFMPVIAIGLGVGGWYFFSHSASMGVVWLGPWLVLCVLTAVKFTLLPVWSLLEGCNQIKQVYRFRLYESMIGALGLWLSLWLGGRLWAASVSTGATIIFAVLYIVTSYLPFFKSLIQAPQTATIHFQTEIWPMQWRMALSWMVGYFMFSMFIPILFYYHGPVVAGQMGMTWTLVSALSLVASSVIYTKAPKFGALIAKREYAKLDDMAHKSATISVVIAIVGGIVVLMSLIVMQHFQIPLASRLLGPWPTALFLVATVLMQLTQVQATYLRAHKQEPLMGLSVVCGVSMGILSWILGKQWGAMGIAVSYLAVIASISLPISTWIWSRRRMEWHQDGDAVCCSADL